MSNERKKENYEHPNGIFCLVYVNQIYCFCGLAWKFHEEWVSSYTSKLVGLSLITVNASFCFFLFVLVLNLMS